MNILKNKVLKTLLFIYVLSFCIGVSTYFFIDSSIIDNSILSYFNSFKNDISYLSYLKDTLFYNFSFSLIIWICGILLIGIIFSPFIIFLKGLGLGISIISIIVNFKLKGLILALIIFISNVLLFDIIFILLSYYGFNMSIRTIKIIRKNLSINFKSFYKNYILRYIILSILLVLTSLIDVYLISSLIKYIII